MTREEETVCIQRICAGDANAFEPLVLEYQTSIYHLVYRIVQDSQDATDLTQEIFLQAYRSLSSFRGESRFFVWLYRLACNCCTDFLRKKSVVTVSLTVEENSGEFSELEIPDLRFSPEYTLEQKELRTAIQNGLRQLSPTEREILTLREFSGCSYEEISEILSLELGTVRSRIYRARKKLCAILVKDGNFSCSFPSQEQKEV